MGNYEIEKLEIVVGEIPLKIFRPKKYSIDRKTIIHYHGWTSSVENYELFAEVFAHKGYQMILPELEGHGNRNKQDFDEFEGFVDVLIQTVAEFRDIKNVAVERFNANPDNIAISGHSLGGMVAICNFMIDTSIKLGIMYNSLADFKLLQKGLSDSITEDDKETLDLLDPMQRLENIGNRDLLILTGQVDKVISPKAMEEFEKTLTDSNIKSDGIKFLKYPNSGHDIAYKMTRDVIEACKEIIGKTSFTECCQE